ncbi:MAG: hypothetical protein H0X41_01210 [Chitinophagaceae bacterium]|nr:hypothetical protein [Chitinophagaceae bacterium]
MKIALAGILFLFILTTTISAQDTLPRFTVIYKGNNRNAVSWTNPFPFTAQISIQRSVDSTKNFKTILTVPDAMVPQNGYVDVKNTTPLMYYRLFIVLDSGKYQFTRSKRPAPDTAKAVSVSDPLLKNESTRVITDSLTNKEAKALKEKISPPVVPKPEKFFIIKRRDSIVNTISEKYIRRFRDSIVYSTKDTLLFTSADIIQIKPFVPKEVYKASKFVYTEKYGNVMIALPDADKKKYSVSFFDEKRNPLFEIKEVTSGSLTVDKTNFVHSGWFWFELYEEGKLKEKNKLFLPKDF